MSIFTSFHGKLPKLDIAWFESGRPLQSIKGLRADRQRCTIATGVIRDEAVVPPDHHFGRPVSQLPSYPPDLFAGTKRERHERVPAPVRRALMEPGPEQRGLPNTVVQVVAV